MSERYFNGEVLLKRCVVARYETCVEATNAAEAEKKILEWFHRTHPLDRPSDFDISVKVYP